LVFQKTLFKKFRLKDRHRGERPVRRTCGTTEAKNQFPHPNFLFQGRETTKYKTALPKANFDYQASLRTALALKYRRVDPDYKTLGRLFLQQRHRGVDAEPQHQPVPSRPFRLNASGGIQRNNLDGSKPNRLNRLVGSLDAAYSKGPLSLTANYSNNSADVAYLLDPRRPRAQRAHRHAGRRVQRHLHNSADTSSQNQHVFNLTGNAQLVTDDVEDPTTSSFSQMLVGNFVYSLGLGFGLGLFGQGQLQPKRAFLALGAPLRNGLRRD
jgi:hypothetical protein